MVKIIRGGRIFDGTGAEPISDGIITMEHGKITYVGSKAEFTNPKQDTQVIDVSGRTVLPGLIDLHVHLIAGYQRPPEYHHERAVSASITKAYASCERALRHGITTVRDVGAGHLGIFALRDAINMGEIKGPRIFAAGKAISMTGGCHWDVICRQADGPEECRKAAREQLRPLDGIWGTGSGADLIKVFATDHGYNRTRIQLGVEEMTAVVEEALKQGRRVCAHVGGAAGAINCVRAGVHSIEHGNIPDGKSIQAMKDAGTYYVPTLVVYWEPAVLGTNGGFSEEEVGYCRLCYGPHKVSLQMALEAGIKIGAGSDHWEGHPIGSTLHKELELMVEYGMSPTAALRAATGVAAEILGEEARFGTLEIGKAADIVVVDGNPLVDIAAIQKIWLVMKDGQRLVDNRFPTGNE
jgi:imidazolonepropionase-like amidohydrolase